METTQVRKTDMSEAEEEVTAKKRRLTNRQRAFVAEYLRDFNASRAARAVGYSERSARAIGQENLTKPDIAQAIADEIAERAMGADEVLLRLAEHARGDMADFLDISSMSFSVDLKKAHANGKTHLIKKVKMRTVTSLSKEGVETETHDMEIELYDAQDALIALAKKHKLLTENRDITSNGESIVKLIKGVSFDDI